MPLYCVSITIEVHDPEELAQAAAAHAVAEGDDPKAFTADDIGACLVMLLDPGSLPGCAIDCSEVDDLGDLED